MHGSGSETSRTGESGYCGTQDFSMFQAIYGDCLQQPVHRGKQGYSLVQKLQPNALCSAIKACLVKMSHVLADFENAWDISKKTGRFASFRHCSTQMSHRME
jgi:hypothetical protein